MSKLLELEQHIKGLQSTLMSIEESFNGYENEEGDFVVSSDNAARIKILLEEL